MQGLLHPVVNRALADAPMARLYLGQSARHLYENKKLLGVPGHPVTWGFMSLKQFAKRIGRTADWGFKMEVREAQVLLEKRLGVRFHKQNEPGNKHGATRILIPKRLLSFGQFIQNFKKHLTQGFSLGVSGVKAVLLGAGPEKPGGGLSLTARCKALGLAPVVAS